jgi:hypothetical protein
LVREDATDAGTDTTETVSSVSISEKTFRLDSLPVIVLWDEGEENALSSSDGVISASEDRDFRLCFGDFCKFADVSIGWGGS